MKDGKYFITQEKISTKKKGSKKELSTGIYVEKDQNDSIVKN
jgi:hypothetical protein